MAPASGDGGPSTGAILRNPDFVRVDNAGNLYISESWGYRVRKAAHNGAITTAAGTGEVGTALDGSVAALSPIYDPHGLALDSTGQLYIATGSILFLVSTGGAVKTVVANQGFQGDGGPAASAAVSGAHGICFDGAGNLYIADSGNQRIRKINTSGIITTIAGNGTAGFSGDGGSATSAHLSNPYDVAVDGSGNLYIADRDNNRIRKVTPGGIISTYAGTGIAGSSGDGGIATSALLNAPTGLALDGAGRLYVSENSGRRVRRITPAASSATIETFAGNGNSGSEGDGGLATAAQLDAPAGLAFDTAGNLYIADDGVDQRVRMVTPGGIISTAAGAAHFGGDGGPAVAAQLNFPQSVGIDGAGSLYIADTANNLIRQVTPDGHIRTIAGTGTAGFSGDGGSAVAASLNGPRAVRPDASGNLYIADAGNNRIRKITPGGAISTFAGTGAAGSSGDNGPAVAATMNNPAGLALDSAGNLYIADQFNYRVRMVSPQGIITTVAGKGTTGFSGDGGPATAAALSDLSDVAVDLAGNLYIADNSNYRVRKVSTNGTITTFAGTGVNAVTGDGGPATSAALNNVTGLAVDSVGDVFLSLPYGGKVRMVNPSGIITTVAGTGTRSVSGDGGLAALATLGGRTGLGYQLAVGTGGVVYFADHVGEEIRKLTPNVPAQLVIVSGNNQLGRPSTVLTNELVAAVQDPSGVGVAGVNVSFAVTAGTAKLGVSSALTDSNGLAGVSVVLGAVTGPVVVTATAAGLPSVTFNLTASTTATGPLIPANSVVGAGLSVPVVAQISSGGLASIFGQNFAPAGTFVTVGGDNLVNGQLPTNLAGVCVTVNGQRAPMLLVSPYQLNIQVPSVPQSLFVAVQEISNCDQPSQVESNTITVAGQPATPEFFFFAHNANGQNPVAAIDATSGVNVGPSSPAVTGEVVTIFMTGLGTTAPNYAPAVLPPSAAQVTGAVTVTLGGLPVPAANILYAGVTPGDAGLYQLNLQIPAGTPAGNIPISVGVGGFSTPPGGYLAIGN